LGVPCYKDRTFVGVAIDFELIRSRLAEDDFVDETTLAVIERKPTIVPVDYLSTASIAE
jgi:hypothetical protein